MNRLKRDLMKAGALTLTMAMLFTACSGKNSNDDEDDGTETEETEETEETSGTTTETSETETSETETEPTETTLPEPSQEEIDQAYLDVLRANEIDIKRYENEYIPYSSGTTASINLTDITGDGIDELIFKYVSDSLHDDIDFSSFTGPVFANVSIYTYNRETGTADRIFDAETESSVGNWDASIDVCLLDDGNIFTANMNGRMGYYTQSITEYQFDGNSFVPVNDWVVDEEIPEGVWESGTEDLYCVATAAWCNDQEVPGDDFYSAQQEYTGRLASPLMPCATRLYADEYNAQDIFGRDWCNIPGSFFASGSYTTYNETVASLDPEYAALLASAANRNAAYTAVLNQYEDSLRVIENYQYEPLNTCSYLDITGDGQPELIIQYCSDFEHGAGGNGEFYISGDMRFFTYDPVSGQAVEILHVDNTILNAAGAFYADAILLNNGHIIVTTGWGDEDSETYTNEFELQGDSFVQINTLLYGQYMEYTDDGYDFRSEYYLNDQPISREDYLTYRSNYMDMFDTVITRSVYYDSEWYNPNDWSDAVLAHPMARMSLDDMYALLSD
ncbi:MAG: hypothetical protein J5685_05360 [Clostridiales bacterium]|nr:hypothetical protein [Clostridiales bacterium]